MNRRQRLSLHVQRLPTQRGFGRDITNLERRPLSKDHSKDLSRNMRAPSFKALPVMIQKESSAKTATQPHQAEIYHFLRQVEQGRSGLIKLNSEVTELSRATLIQWLIDSHTKLKLGQPSLFLTMSLLDRVLQAREVKKSRLQLTGLTCFFIAAKFQQTYRMPSIRDLVQLCLHAYKSNQFLQQQSKILQITNFNIHQPNSNTFLNYYAADMEEKQYFLVCYLLELAFVKIKYSVYKPSFLVSAASYLINKIRGRSSHFSLALLTKSGYQQSQVRLLAKDLCLMLQSAQSDQSFRSIRRKYSVPERREVSRIRVQRKKQ